ncbi:unnamed protein product [Somion occarium]|uniref:Uncharacterized protein n=1 Tax=Somion occarium TaxID=3059160 RepID=A0ABP1CSM8_9APHY
MPLQAHRAQCDGSKVKGFKISRGDCLHLPFVSIRAPTSSWMLESSLCVKVVHVFVHLMLATQISSLSKVVFPENGGYSQGRLDIRVNELW